MKRGQRSCDIMSLKDSKKEITLIKNSPSVFSVSPVVNPLRKPGCR